MGSTWIRGAVESGGESIYYEGANLDTDAPTVVLGHGAGGNHAVWFQQVPALAERYRVITWDTRGFGNSTFASGDFGVEHSTADLLTILDATDTAEAHLVGQSMGGWWITGVAISAPQRVRSLSWCDTVGGLWTPALRTEAAGIAVAYGLAVGFLVYRELRWKDLEGLLVTAALRSCVVMFVTTTAFLLAWIIAVGRVPDRLGDVLSSSAGGQLSFLLAANLVLIVIGMFMESISAIIVIMPILFPLALQFGVDPVHFGVLAAVNFCIGMVTPPYGATLFVACSIAGQSVSSVAGWTLRPIAAMLVVQALITLFPETVTALPRWFGIL